MQRTCSTVWFPFLNNGYDNYTAAISLPTNYREDMIRVDQNIGTKTSIFVRYTQDAYEQSYVPTLWSNANYDTVNTQWTAPSKSATLHLVNTFRPDLMNEFIMSLGADVNTINQVTGRSSPAHSINKPSDLAIKNLMPANGDIPLIPGMQVSGGLPFSFAESTGYNYSSGTNYHPERQPRLDQGGGRGGGGGSV